MGRLKRLWGAISGPPTTWKHQLSFNDATHRSIANIERTLENHRAILEIRGARISCLERMVADQENELMKLRQQVDKLMSAENRRLGPALSPYDASQRHRFKPL